MGQIEETKEKEDIIEIAFAVDRCVLCGAIIPEGTMLCYNCLKKLKGD